MASNGEHVDLNAQLRALERGEAAPWTEYPPAAWWFPPLFGAIGAFFVLAFGFRDGPAYPVALTCLVAGSWIATHLNGRRRRPKPSGAMPREFRRSVLLYLLGGVAVCLTVWMIFDRFGMWPAAAAAFVLGWALITWSERMDARAATRLRSRLP